MDYELAKQLKDAGFPQSDKEDALYCSPEGLDSFEDIDKQKAYIPSLEELIEACGDDFEGLFRDRTMKTEDGSQWFADRKENGRYETYTGKTPIKAVAHLYIALNSNKK